MARIVPYGLGQFGAPPKNVTAKNYFRPKIRGDPGLRGGEHPSQKIGTT